jgi:hypothetical protein
MARFDADATPAGWEDASFNFYGITAGIVLNCLSKQPARAAAPIDAQSEKPCTQGISPYAGLHSHHGLFVESRPS